MKINFLLRGKTKQKRLYVRLYITKEVRRECATEFHILADQWDKKSMQLKPQFSGDHVTAELNGKLNDMLSYLLHCTYEAELKSTDISNDWLRNKVNEYFAVPDWRVAKGKPQPHQIYFLEACEKWITDAIGVFVKDRTGIFNEADAMRYKTPLRYVIQFQQDHKARIKMSEMDRTFKAQFIGYLHDDDGMDLKANTIKGYMQKLNYLARKITQQPELLSRATKDKLKDYIDASSSVPKKQRQDYEDVYLSEEEINLILKVQITDLQLDRIRDTFVIGLRTGYRVGDYAQALTIDNINQATNTIRLRSQKTGVVTKLPLHPDIKRILIKHGDLPKRCWYWRDTFNKGIKEVCRLAGINNKVVGAKYFRDQKMVGGRSVGRKIVGEYEKWELVASHTARRSFATNLYLTREFSNQEICELGGWLTETQMLQYIKAHGLHAKQKLENLYRDQAV